ncbi:MAG: UDP-N-acetylglucosamine 4,6-dehydratase (inverting) [Rhodospirillaceae bacterium]|jgi:UDP-N-acetylglucosamine 4,6-dehydratase/5-epimerase|nr:UDP-N-acetylglucosamine 4,6-dehydratase (inverting) [Rhodospirillaceae bacterium]MBT4220509.1 UDP-N-acetylglucosamine 4,6-dehydratase (inverting) [Rhodospirillaceae bacterium]MBT4463070.1 UDP-N-acetylglucosamine 4,6-dehydratase (inverting) [Rhodospirillaceae bacterium]MBT5309373.1 UDP-N-acetylglucosamine 4,6-dehydratase (inverting) [Rhodospirillaceae bacterium]MBT6406274.1 UDP-N-acetylglucosamine 4,6-dehydratase (inverting) [Rhodospirillaceae bacterium]
MLDNKSILVTGGTGSFGKHFIRTVLDRYEPKRLVVYSRDELKQYEMEQEFPGAEHSSIRYFIGDVRDANRLEMAMRGIDYVIHAAALKHVPAAEYNPFECIHTNVLGAENIVNASIRAGVKKVVALSTDKAASPANLYGASKLASDKIFVAANHLSSHDGPRFSVVRYGNVVGSRGSVVPFFQKLVREGADSLPITDPRMTRFWITLEQSIDFVLTSLDRMYGAEIFVPKIPSMKITDLADAIAPGMSTKIVGIRPGEKLHETMITEDDARTTIDIGDRYVIQPAFKDWSAGEGSWKDATRVVENFCYASDTNTHWMDADELIKILSGSIAR